MTLDERGLIANAQDGDVASFELLIRPHQARLFRVILAVTRNHEDAEDCLQEALINAYRAIPQFRGDSAFCTWLYRIALNATRNWIRSQARAASSRIADRVPLELQSDPEYTTIERSTTELLRKALLSLPDHYREPLLLRHYRNMTYEEIARVLGVPIGTVRSRLAHGRCLLAARLRALGHTPNTAEADQK